MPNLKEVKTRIQSVTSTQQMTKAMKMVAAAKLRKAQDAIISLRPHATRLTEVLRSLTAGSGVAEMSSLSGETEEESILLIPISSDRGLCGAFNSNVSACSWKFDGAPIRKEVLGLFPKAIHKNGGLVL